MRVPRWVQIVRQFPENGIKLLLTHRFNVRDLLAMTGTAYVPLIGFDRLTLERTTFVQRDFRHVEADVVLRAPLRAPPGQRSRRLTIYILLEHLSAPDWLMPLRVMDYTLQIFKTQVRLRQRRHRTSDDLALHPVLPVVLYTGLAPWERLPRLRELVALGEEFAAVTPDQEPLFVNLSALPAARLESAGGYFGWVLRLLQEREARPEEFRSLLGRVVAHLETMPAADRLRWLELLSYIHALVYHMREPAERAALQETIAASVRTGEHRRRVGAMRMTIAEEIRREALKQGKKKWKKEGEVQALQRNLLYLLQQRFGEIPVATIGVIQKTKDVQRLEGWLARVVNAAILEEVGIG